MPTTFVTIDDPAGNNTDARGINDAGQIVGDYNDGSRRQAFLLSGGSYTTLPQIPDSIDTVASGINASGQIVGFYATLANNSGHKGFLYSNGTYTNIDTGAIQGGTFAQGMNDAGQIVGYSYSIIFLPRPFFTKVEGFLYSNGSFTTIDDPSAVAAEQSEFMPGRESGTFAESINNAGQIVGYYNAADDKVHGFLYSGGTYTTLDDPLGALGTFTTGINNFGQIVGYFIDVNGGIHGFIDTGGVYTTIDNPSAVGGTYVYGINNLARSSVITSTLAATGMALLRPCPCPRPAAPPRT